jgi:hypothetical protein
MTAPAARCPGSVHRVDRAEIELVRGDRAVGVALAGDVSAVIADQPSALHLVEEADTPSLVKEEGRGRAPSSR